MAPLPALATQSLELTLELAVHLEPVTTCSSDQWAQSYGVQGSRPVAPGPEADHGLIPERAFGKKDLKGNAMLPGLFDSLIF